MTKVNPTQPIYIDDKGTARFRENKIVHFLLNVGTIDMNKLFLMSFSDEDRMQFAQLIGFSVDLYNELSYASVASRNDSSEAVCALLAGSAEKKAFRLGVPIATFTNMSYEVPGSSLKAVRALLGIEHLKETYGKDATDKAVVAYVAINEPDTES